MILAQEYFWLLQKELRLEKKLYLSSDGFECSAICGMKVPPCNNDAVLCILRFFKTRFLDVMPWTWTVAQNTFFATAKQTLTRTRIVFAMAAQRPSICVWSLRRSKAHTRTVLWRWTLAHLHIIGLHQKAISAAATTTSYRTASGNTTSICVRWPFSLSL